MFCRISTYPSSVLLLIMTSFIQKYTTLYNNEKDNKTLYFWVLNLINSSKDFLFSENKLILNHLFGNKFKQNFAYNFSETAKLDLTNYEHFQFCLKMVMQDKSQYLYSILLLYALTPTLFGDYTKEDDKKYKFRLIRHMTYEAEKHGMIYRNITYLCKDLRGNMTYYYSYSGTSNKSLYELICRLFRLICPALNYERKIFSINKKIKIGFFGNNMTFNHSIANNQLGTFKFLSEDDRFEVFAVTYKNEGTLNDYFEKNKDKIIVIGQTDDTEDCIDKMIENINKHNFDIIVYTEIGMDLVFKCLAHCRLARRQFNTWGHSETSGIDTIDYYISSKYFEEKEAQNNYSEQLIRMDSLSTCYAEKVLEMFNNACQRNMLKEFNRKNKLKLPETAKLYGCLQLYHKYDESFIRTSNEILRRDKNAYIVVLDYKEYEKEFRTFMNKIVPHDRVIFVEKCNFYVYCQYLDMCDVIIDNINFGGCNSTLQAFVLGKIVITFPQKTLCTNFTSGFYKKIQYTDPVCHSEEEFVEKAILFANTEDKQEISEKISTLSKQLFDEKESCDDWVACMLNHNS